MDITIKRQITFKDGEIWENVLGSAFETYGWWRGVEYFGAAAWDKPGTVQLTIADPNDLAGDGEATISKEITERDIADALEHVLDHGYYHCGERITAEPGWLDFDSCAGDVILQVVMFGDTVYA